LRARLTPQVAATRKAVRQLISDLTPGTTILVAVSGGADSLALASAANFEGRKLKLNVAAVIIDHGLQLGSEKVAKKAKSRCESLGIEQVVIEKVTVRQSGDGLEAQARESRYKGIEDNPAMVLRPRHERVDIKESKRSDQSSVPAGFCLAIT